MLDISEDSPAKSQKSERFWYFYPRLQHLKTHDGLPFPRCGCVLFIPKCDCIEHCRCELDVELCGCEWPLEDLIIWGAFLESIDPASYAELPSPITPPQFTVKRSGRVRMMAERYQSNSAIWHPSDIPADQFKSGALLSTTRNGECVFHGSNHPPANNWRGRAAS